MTVYGIGFPHYNLQKIQQTLDEKSRSSSCKPLGCHDPSNLVVLGGCSSRFGTGTSYSNVHTKDGFTRKDLRYKLGCATSSDRIIGCIEKGLRVWFSFFFSSILSILHRERFSMRPLYVSKLRTPPMAPTIARGEVSEPRCLSRRSGVPICWM